MTIKYISVVVLMASALASGCSHSESRDIGNMSRQDQVNAMKADPSKMPASERAKIDAAMAKVQQARPGALPQAPK